MFVTRVVLGAQVVLALVALGLDIVAGRVALPASHADTFFVVPPPGLGTACALLLVTGVGGLAASYARQAWPRRAAYAALLLPVLLEAATTAGGGDGVSGFAYGQARLLTMLRLLTWSYRAAGVAALLALAAAVVLIVRDVREIRSPSYPQPLDPGEPPPAARD